MSFAGSGKHVFEGIAGYGGVDRDFSANGEC